MNRPTVPTPAPSPATSQVPSERRSVWSAGPVTLGVLSITLLACGGLFGGDDEEGAEEGTTGSTTDGTTDVADYEGPVPEDQSVAGREVAVELCTVEDLDFSADSTMSVFKSVAVDGERLLVATGDGKLHALKIDHADGCVLRPDTAFGDGGTMTFEREVEWVSAGSGTVIAANGISESYVIRGNSVAYTCDADGYIELDASGKWGIAPWVNSTVERVQLDAGACSSSSWSLQNLSDDATRKGNFTSVNASVIIGDTVFIGGPLAESIDPDKMHTIGVFTADGKEVRRFGGSSDISSPQKFGWVHAINGCSPGVCVLDSNFRRVTLWDDGGSFLGEIDLKALLGLDYPWINDFAVGSDGAAWFIAGNDAGNDTAYGYIYRVTGLAEGTAQRSPVATRRLKKVLETRRSGTRPRTEVPDRPPVDESPGSGPPKTKAKSKGGGKKGKGKGKGGGKKGKGKGKGGGKKGKSKKKR